MSRGQRLSFLGIAAVIAVVAVILLAGGGDDTDEAGTPASTATATSTATADTGGATAEEETPTPKPKPVLLQAGKEKALDYEQGETVRFRVRSDEAEEVHVHGYDIKKELEPGKTETVSFRATIPGIFRIELEHSQTLLAQLKVVP
jgi:hypothetical protein